MYVPVIYVRTYYNDAIFNTNHPPMPQLATSVSTAYCSKLPIFFQIFSV